MTTPTLRIVLAPLEIRGETVRFAWSQSHDWSMYGAQAFSMRWHDLDLAMFADGVFHDVFLSLFLKLLVHYRNPVELVFPTPVSRESAAYWTAFHGAHNVTISPTTDAVTGTPWRGDARPAVSQHPHSVFFGGGKDSLGAFLMLRELDGPDVPLLIHVASPLQPGAGYATTYRTYRERHILQPTERRLGATIQRIETDFRGHVLPESRTAWPHIELYTSGSLPAIIARGVSTVFFTNGRHAYHMTVAADGKRTFAYAKSRPEYVRTQMEHYRREFGIDLTLTTSSGLTENFSNFKILSERYPEHLDLAVTCPSMPSAGFCGECTKCAFWVLLDLAHGGRDRRIDPSRAIARFTRFDRILARALDLAEASTGTNAPWDPVLTSRVDSPSYLRAVHLADPGLVRDPRARTTLEVIKAVWGNDPHEEISWMSRNAVSRLHSPVARRMAPLLAEHLPVVDTITGPLRLDGEPIVLQGWEEDMPLPAALEPWATPITGAPAPP